MLDDEVRTDRALRALADPTRRDILLVVLQGEASVSALAARYPMSFAAVQKHVAVLERAQLVTKRRRGREQRVVGNVEEIRRTRAALDALEAVWRHRVDQMHLVLAEDRPVPDPEPRSTS